MSADAWSYAVGSVVAAIIAGGFGIYIAKITRQTRAQVTPSNGTKTAKLIEETRHEVGCLAVTVAQLATQHAAFQARVEPYLKDKV